MKRIFLLKGLDCPNCSAKIEKEVGELDGVQSSVVNLMKQTLTINVTQTAADTIASQIETIVHSHEPDVEVSEIVQESYIPEKKREANDELLPVKRTEKKYIIFPAGNQPLLAVFHAARHNSCFSMGVSTPKLRCTLLVL